MISYSVNSLAVTAGCLPLSDFTNTAIQPRFVAVPRAAFGAASGSASPVTAAGGQAGYRPTAGQRDPKWFDSWNYRGGCPPLPAVGHILVTRSRDRIKLHWATLGPGVRYQVYLRGLGRGYILVRTVRRASVTLSNLTPDSRYRVLIVPENNRQRTGSGAAVSVTTADG